MKNRKRIYLLIILAVIAAFGIKYLTSLRNVEIVKGATGLVRTKQWNPVIASSVNNSIISLKIDGKRANIDSGCVYMDDSLNVMISCDILTELLSCAVNVYYGNMAVIEKSGTRIIATAGSTTYMVDGEEVKLDAAPAKVDSSVYIPVIVLGQYFSYEYKWDYRNNTAELTNSKPDEKIIPYAYDYRNDGKVSSVKDQSDLGTCWAFASLTALETSLLPEHRFDFSEDHMSCHNGYNLNQNQGGEYTMAMSYLASWKGPVLESQDPYGDGISPDGLEPAVHVQEMQIIESKNLDGIKKAVFLYGGVQSSLYMSVSDAGGNGSQFYNADREAYCYIGTEKANHDIVIVGWDDAYSAENFSTTPEGDGAFVCVNSWGEHFGDNGYFYVSYFDSNIGLHNLVYTGIEDCNNYDNIYQSDICGWVGQLGYGREYAYFANVYRARENEKLEAVSFYATGVDTEYQIYYVDQFKDEASLSNRVLLAAGSFSNAGYYTVKIDRNVKLTKGERYAIVVYIKTPNSVHPIAIEYNSDSSTSTVDISDGESYISLYGDLWEHVEETQNCNVCLKMFTDNN